MLSKLKTILLIMIYLVAIVPASFAVSSINATDDGSLEDLGFDDSVNTRIENSTAEDSITIENSTTINSTTEEEVEVVTEDEASILSTSLGAQVRMLQLQKRIEVQSEAGQLVVDKINEVKPEFDTTRLEEIIVEFNVLVSLIEEYDYEQSQEGLVNDYVGIKKQAIGFTQEFRNIAKDSLSESDKVMLRERVEERKQERLQARDERLNNLKQYYNLQQLEKFAIKMGYDVEAAKVKLINGEITIDDVRRELLTDYQSLDDNQKVKIQAELKEARIKSNIEIKEKRAELQQETQDKRAEFQKKAQERRTEFQQKVEEQRVENQKKVEDRRSKSQERNDNSNSNNDEVETEEFQDNIQ